MKVLKKIFGRSAPSILTMTFLALFGYQNCNSSSNSSNNDSPQSVQIQVAIDDVISYGFQSPGNIQIEIDGTFSGSDSVSVSCPLNPSAQTSIINDTAGEIDLTLSGIGTDDNCAFAVQSGSSSALESPIFISSWQTALSISVAADSGTGTAGAGYDLVVLNGIFDGSSYDQVYVSCDGNDFSPIPANINDTSQAIDFAMPTPNSFASCYFVVIANGVNSQIYSVTQ